MNQPRRLHLFIRMCLFPLVLAALAEAAPTGVRVTIDWPAFLSRHDLVWDRPPQSWDEAPFMGNGMLGTLLWYDPGSNALRLQLGRSDVQDHRGVEAGKQPLFDRARLPIGDFLIKPRGRILATSHFRLNLWNAETTGTIITDRGSIEIATYVHSAEMAVVFEARGSEGEKGFRIDWRPAEAISPRQAYAVAMREKDRMQPGYVPNPPPRTERAADVSVCVQPLLAGGETVTAWRANDIDGTRRLIATVAHSFPSDAAHAAAISTVNRVAAIDPAALRQSHRAWWHRYYPRSFLSLSDTRLESFYWIQMYKLASATRGDRALIDTQGPWLEQTPWPGAFWNLNVQLTYWPVYTANRLELGESLLNTLWTHRQTLMDNVAPPYRADSSGIGRATGMDLAADVGVPGGSTGDWARDEQNVPEVGLLTWACHNLWLQYRCSMDDGMLREKLYPLLRRAINYYLHFLAVGADGRLHLPATYSPEYGIAPDCNFDLSLLRWGCQTLLWSCDRLRIDDALRPRWRDVLDRLTDYPQDKNGFMIGRGVPYAMSHRHFSHLLMIYPLHLVTPEEAGGREIIAKSLAYWQSKRAALAGYSYTGAASIAATLGRGDEALNYLHGLFEGFLSSNTMYKEAGPCIETPLAAAQSIHDMILQSWGEKIRVFPAVPAAWSDVVFQDLRAEGDFLVSARRNAGTTDFVQITSCAGEPCVVVTDMRHPVASSKDRPIDLVPLGQDAYRLRLAKGETVLIAPAGSTRPPVISAVAAVAANCNTYGVNARATRIFRRNPDIR